LTDYKYTNNYSVYHGMCAV